MILTREAQKRFPRFDIYEMVSINFRKVLYKILFLMYNKVKYNIRSLYMDGKPAYNRVLLKLSGEALAKDTDGIFNHEYMDEVAGVIKKCCDAGVQIAIIVGAGNIWRGRSGGSMDRTRADNIGMLATCMNSIALQESLCKTGLDARVMSAVQMDKFAELFTAEKARRHLDKGRVVIFACGLGSPYFSTDTPAVIRAMEIEADALLLAKNIDYLYTADPRIDPTAVKIEETTYTNIIDNRLNAIDMTASVLAESGHVPAVMFSLDEPEKIYRVVMGEKLGTIVR